MTTDRLLNTQTGRVSYADRCARLRQVGMVLWLTGLSGSGKTTIAIEAEKHLFDRGRHVVRLDGDLLRRGLNADLGFSEADRAENIRRAAQAARLLYDTGAIVLACFIAPQQRMRSDARALFPPGSFYEVFVQASLPACVARDPKGYYQKALKGEIKDYTGLEQGYEIPQAPDLILDTEQHALDVCVRHLLEMIESVQPNPPIPQRGENEL